MKHKEIFMAPEKPAIMVRVVKKQDRHDRAHVQLHTHTTADLAGNEIRGRLAGWIVWRSSVDEGLTSAMCVMFNLSSATIMFSI